MKAIIFVSQIQKECDRWHRREKLSLHNQEKLLSHNETVRSWMKEQAQKEAAAAIPKIKDGAVMKKGKSLISTCMKARGIPLNEKGQPRTISWVTGTCFPSPKVTIGPRSVGWRVLSSITLCEPE